MSKMKLTLGYMAALLLFTACTQDEAGTLPDGTQPLKLTAAIGGEVATRTTADGTWEEEDAITLSIDANTYTYQYEGTDWTSSAPYFWQEGDAAISVSAYSFGGKATGGYAVQADQQTGDGYQSSDLLYAPAVEVAHGEEASLTFYHQTAKVVVNIKKEGIMAENPTHEVAIQGALSGTFTAPTGKETYGTWTNLTESSSITPQSITPANSEYAAFYQALLIPQTIDDAFISITIDDKTYRYTPETGTTLQPGHVYTYNITVFSYGLDVQVTESINWSATNTGSGGITLHCTYDENTNTYTVYTAEGLNTWAEKANADPNTNCTLATDITLTDEWEPIGNETYNYEYTGTFDGNGHAIRNLRQDGDYELGGLISHIGTDGCVKNLILSEVNINNTYNGYSISYVGAVTGYNEGTISNCEISGSVSQTSVDGNLGSLVGNNTGNIEYCRSSATIHCDRSNYYVGGLVGYHNSASTSSFVRGCSFSGNISGGYNVGGIIGWCPYFYTVIACYSTGTLSNEYNKGGIVGFLQQGSETKACYWEGFDGASFGYCNSGEGTGAYKVDGIDITWAQATEAMNAILGVDAPYHWQTNDPNTPPTLVEVDN